MKFPCSTIRYILIDFFENFFIFAPSIRLTLKRYDSKDSKQMETTLNIHAKIATKITIAARTKNISRSELILILIKKIMDDVSQPSRFGAMVKYQERSTGGAWKTFHLVVREDDYEYLLDLRKLLKMSVSHLLAYAIKKFLSRLMKNKITDNYQYHNYMVIREIIDNVICWKFVWGFPRTLEKLLPSRS